MLFTKIKKISVIAFLTVAVVLLSAYFVALSPKRAFAAESTVHTYTESTDEIVNPAAGFYKRVTVRLSRNSSSVSPSIEDDISRHSKNYGILQLCFDLADFSANAGGKDAEIDDNALSAMAKVFGYLRNHKVGAIVRFDYNRDGLQDPNTYKYLNREPSLEWVLKHVESVAGVITQYSDVVLGVESGMLGPWGEQHSTALASSGADTYYELVQKWLDCTPDAMGITVRRPLYFVHWANKKFNLSLSVSDLAAFDASAYSQAERVGVFNDGYLGSDSDLGTFTDRAAETAFIGKQAERTYYGGELVADGSSGGVVGKYNSISKLETEGFITHTSYLNRDWNDQVFNVYEKATYTGNDSLYNNGTTKELTYVKNRLGYRFYLSESHDAVATQTGEFNLKFTISNAGFARILCPTRSELVFTNGSREVAVECDVDLARVPSAQSTAVVGTKQFELSVAFPEELPSGSYDVYLRFYTEYGAEIRMANDLSICASDRKGVKIASVDKTALVTLSGITATYSGKQYFTSGEFDRTELIVKAFYSDGTDNTVTDYTLSAFDMTAGTKNVTVTYVEDGVTKTTTFTFTVNAVTLTSLTVKTPPTKTEYKRGDSIDLTGLVLTATYSDGTTADIPADKLSNYGVKAEGKQLMLNMDGQSIAFGVIVEESQSNEPNPTPNPTPSDNDTPSQPLDVKKIAIIGAAAAIGVACLAIVIVIIRRRKK